MTRLGFTVERLRRRLHTLAARRRCFPRPRNAQATGLCCDFLPAPAGNAGGLRRSATVFQNDNNIGLSMREPTANLGCESCQKTKSCESTTEKQPIPPKKNVWQLQLITVHFRGYSGIHSKNGNHDRKKYLLRCYLDPRETQFAE